MSQSVIFQTQVHPSDTLNARIYMFQWILYVLLKSLSLLLFVVIFQNVNTDNLYLRKKVLRVVYKQYYWLFT